MQGVPIAILRPMIGVTEGVTKTLIGVQKSLDPSLEEEMTTKFKNRPPRPTSSVEDEEEDYTSDDEERVVRHPSLLAGKDKERLLNGRGSAMDDPSNDLSTKTDASGDGLLIELDSDSDF